MAPNCAASRANGPFYQIDLEKDGVPVAAATTASKNKKRVKCFIFLALVLQILCLSAFFSIIFHKIGHDHGYEEGYRAMKAVANSSVDYAYARGLEQGRRESQVGPQGVPHGDDVSDGPSSLPTQPFRILYTLSEDGKIQFWGKCGPLGQISPPTLSDDGKVLSWGSCEPLNEISSPIDDEDEAAPRLARRTTAAISSASSGALADGGDDGSSNGWFQWALKIKKSKTHKIYRWIYRKFHKHRLPVRQKLAAYTIPTFRGTTMERKYYKLVPWTWEVPEVWNGSFSDGVIDTRWPDAYNPDILPTVIVQKRDPQTITPVPVPPTPTGPYANGGDPNKYAGNGDRYISKGVPRLPKVSGHWANNHFETPAGPDSHRIRPTTHAGLRLPDPFNNQNPAPGGLQDAPMGQDLNWHIPQTTKVREWTATYLVPTEYPDGQVATHTVVRVGPYLDPLPYATPVPGQYPQQQQEEEEVDEEDSRPGYPAQIPPYPSQQTPAPSQPTLTPDLPDHTSHTTTLTIAGEVITLTVPASVKATPLLKFSTKPYASPLPSVAPSVPEAEAEAEASEVVERVIEEVVEEVIEEAIEEAIEEVVEEIVEEAIEEVLEEIVEGEVVEDDLKAPASQVPAEITSITTSTSTAASTSTPKVIFAVPTTAATGTATAPIPKGTGTGLYEKEFFRRDTFDEDVLFAPETEADKLRR